MTLMLLPGFPIIIGTGLMLAVAMSNRADETIKSYAKCLGISTQALKAIKLVQAYNNEKTELQAYGRRLNSNRNKTLKEVKMAALAIGLIYCLFYFFYAYSLFVGGRLRVLEIAQKEGGRNYTGGQVLTIMLCVILGSFDLGTVITHIQKVREGKRAACTILSVVENSTILDGVDSKV